MGRKSNASRRREQIVWALYDCLASRGQEKVTVKEIAARAGLPSGVIHYYFKSKDDIISSLAEAIVEKYGSLINEKIAAAPSVEKKIDSAIDFIVDELVFNLQLNRVFYNLIQMAFERRNLEKVVRGLLKEYRRRLARVFEEAGAGKASKGLGAALVAVTEGFSLQYLVDPKAFNRREVRRLIGEAVAYRLSKSKSTGAD
jgi:AcrR family transcriptional regulator